MSNSKEFSQAIRAAAGRAPATPQRQTGDFGGGQGGRAIQLGPHLGMNELLRAANSLRRQRLFDDAAFYSQLEHEARYGR